MDLNFSKEDLDFQSEVREFLDKEYPKHIKEKMDNGDDLTRDEIVEWHKVVAKKGWMGHSWPVEHGGTGWDATKKYIYLRVSDGRLSNVYTIWSSNGCSCNLDIWFSKTKGLFLTKNIKF